MDDIQVEFALYSSSESTPLTRDNLARPTELSSTSKNYNHEHEIRQTGIYAARKLRATRFSDQQCLRLFMITNTEQDRYEVWFCRKAMQIPKIVL